MNFDGTIFIKDIIVHILDPKEDYHKLSDFKIESHDALNNLIIKYITTSLKHDSRRFSKFNIGDNIVKQSSINILNNNDNDESFIEQTKNISKELFRSMKGTNASPTNFMIIKYKHGDNNAVALLKLDFNVNFYTQPVEKDGKIKVDVKINSAGFNSKQKLQKCVFIYDSILMDENSEIIVLDKQSKEEISNYFGSTFLKSTLVIDAKTNTKKMIDEVINFINEKYNDNPQVQLNKSYELTSYFKECDNFEIDSLINRVFGSEDIGNEFKEAIKNKKLDYAFEIDKTVVEKRFKRRSITTSNGITLRANESLFNSQSIDIGEKDDEGFVDITIKKVKIVKNE
ncbi:nucleoid-associated protein [Clostridium sp. Marseille-Q7071]